MPDRTTSLSRSDQVEPQLAQLLQAARDLVARLQPDPLVLRLAVDDALGRAGEVDVAWLQRHHPRGKADELPAVEDHVVGVPVLPLLAVDTALQAEIVRVTHEIARHEVGTE